MSKSNIAGILKGFDGPAPKTIVVADQIGEILAPLQDQAWAKIDPMDKAMVSGVRSVLVAAEDGKRKLVALGALSKEALLEIVGESRNHYIVTKEDVRKVHTGDPRFAPLGHVQPQDVGKMLVEVSPGFWQAENDEQFKKRTGVKADASADAQRHQKIVDYFKSKGIDYEALGDDSPAQDALMHEHSAEVEKYIAGVQAAAVTHEFNEKGEQVQPKVKDHYDDLEDKKRPAVVVDTVPYEKDGLGKPKATIYTAKEVSIADIQKAEGKFALAVWCVTMEDARAKAKALELRRADYMPLPDRWDVPAPEADGDGIEEKKSEAMNTGKVRRVKEIKKNYSPQAIQKPEEVENANQQLEKVRRGQVQAARIKAGASEVLFDFSGLKPGQPWYGVSGPDPDSDEDLQDLRSIAEFATLDEAIAFFESKGKLAQYEGYQIDKWEADKDGLPHLVKEFSTPDHARKEEGTADNSEMQPAGDQYKRAVQILKSRYGVEPNDLGGEAEIRRGMEGETADEYVERMAEKLDLQTVGEASGGYGVRSAKIKADEIFEFGEEGPHCPTCGAPSDTYDTTPGKGYSVQELTCKGCGKTFKAQGVNGSKIMAVAGLYEALHEAGLKLDHHESDLYVEDTPEAQAIIKRFGAVADPFIDNIEHRPWLDIAFAYTPFFNRHRDELQAGAPVMVSFKAYSNTKGTQDDVVQATVKPEEPSVCAVLEQAGFQKTAPGVYDIPRLKVEDAKAAFQAACAKAGLAIEESSDHVLSVSTREPVAAAQVVAGWELVDERGDKKMWIDWSKGQPGNGEFVDDVVCPVAITAGDQKPEDVEIESWISYDEFKTPSGKGIAWGGSVKADFMEKQVFESDGVDVELKGGESFVAPWEAKWGSEKNHETMAHFGIKPEDIVSVTPVHGWFGRYSAPGYMDATEYVFDEDKAACESELERIYGDQDDDLEVDAGKIKAEGVDELGRTHFKQDEDGRGESDDVDGYDVRAYDNGGETADRYTIIIEDPESLDQSWLGSSEDPFHPQGFGQHVGDGGQNQEGPHLGKRIKFSELPAKVQQFVRQDTKAMGPKVQAAKEWTWTEFLAAIRPYEKAYIGQIEASMKLLPKKDGQDPRYTMPELQAALGQGGLDDEQVAAISQYLMGEHDIVAGDSMKVVFNNDGTYHPFKWDNGEAEKFLAVKQAEDPDAGWQLGVRRNGVNMPEGQSDLDESWDTGEVSLWIMNDEPLYLASRRVRDPKTLETELKPLMEGRPDIKVDWSNVDWQQVFEDVKEEDGAAVEARRRLGASVKVEARTLVQKRVAKPLAKRGSRCMAFQAGGDEYMVFRAKDAKRLASLQINSDLDAEGLALFDPSFVTAHIDHDALKNYMTAVFKEMADQELAEGGLKAEDQAPWTMAFIAERMGQDQGQSYWTHNFGPNSLGRIMLDNGIVNRRAMAQAAMDVNGAATFLASDGHIKYIGGGLACARLN